MRALRLDFTADPPLSLNDIEPPTPPSRGDWSAFGPVWPGSAGRAEVVALAKHDHQAEAAEAAGASVVQELRVLGSYLYGYEDVDGERVRTFDLLTWTVADRRLDLGNWTTHVSRWRITSRRWGRQWARGAAP